MPGTGSAGDRITGIGQAARITFSIVSLADSIRGDGQGGQEAAQQRRCLAFIDAPDGMAAGGGRHVPAVEAGLRTHLRSAQAAHIAQRAFVLGDAGCQGLAAPETVAYHARVVADQGARAGIAVHVARRVAVADAIGRAGIVTEQAAHIAVTAHRAAGVTVGDRTALVVADQAARIVFGGRDIAVGIAAAHGGDSTIIAAIIPYQAADIAQAAGIAAGIAIDDAAAILPGQAPHFATAAADGAAGMAGADGAVEILAHQATDTAFPVDGRRCVAIADQTCIRTDQAADGEGAVDAATEQADIADERSPVCIADQARIVVAGAVDIQAADGMALAIQASCERVVARADGNEAGAAPDILAVRRAAGVDVATQHIRGAWRHGHQLQLVGILDGGRVLGCQHRICGAGRATGIVQTAVHVDQHPVVARCARRGGEVKARETAGRAHLRIRQAGAAIRTGLASAADGPETVADLVGIGITANQAADAAAAIGEDQAACGEAGADTAPVDANQAADISLARHASRGIAVADAAAIVADQATCLSLTPDGAGGVAIVDAAIVARHQTAADGVAIDVERSIAVADGARVCADQAAGYIRGPDTAAIQAHILNQGILGGDGKQAAALVARGSHTELIDRVAEPIEHAAKTCVAAEWREANAPAGLPAGCGGGVDVCAQHIIPIQLAINALQVGASDAAGCSQGGNHRVAGAHAVRAQFGAEVLPGGQTHLRAAAQLIHGRVAGGSSALAVFQRQAGRAGTVQVGIDIDVALGIQGQLVGRPADLVVDMHVARRATAALRALDDHIAVAQIVRQGGAADVAAAGGDGEVDGVDQPGAGTARRCCRADAGVVADLHVGGTRFDEAAIAASGGAGVQGAGHMGGACAHAAEQDDAAVALFHAARFDDARVVDDAGQQRIAGTCAHQHLAAISADQAAVLGQVVQGALVDLQLQQARTVKAQGGGAAGAQGDRAEAGRNAAVVAHLPAQQGDIAAVGRAQRAFIDDPASTIAAKCMLSAAQAGVVDVERRGHQAAHVDLRAAAEQHAVRIDQVHLAIRVDPAENLRAIAVEDAVDGQRAGRGLDEVDGFIRAHVKTVPVQRCLLARLLDRGAVALLADAGRACHDLPARGRGLRRPSQRQRRHGGRCRGQFAAAALAASARGFRDGDPGVQDVAPDEAVDVIQRSVTVHAMSLLR
ncbi:hypothetical protein JAB1_57900 [Janthinobacterium sp. MP5059B]|nr:hypothetical protein JAB1_57900 [Janthinobacterium sp. MP5059B]